MCSTISMPADYEMLVSHSPPVFSHSPPATYLSDYGAYRTTLHYDAPYGRSMTRGGCRVSPPSSLAIYSEPATAKTPKSPRRPCLVLRTDESTPVEYQDPLSPTRLKKKVVFADDRGMSLTQVRVMSEPSGVPPVLKPRFLAEVTKGLSADVCSDPWEVMFPQPASDYLDFRRRLEHDKVSLENVIVRENEECVVGTIKVRNLAFHKEVIVRCSADEWKTHEDVFCKFVNNPSLPGSASGHYIVYDTFSFRLTLPPRSRCLEFCVCFRCGGEEYWDNNAGVNYILQKKVSEVSKINSADVITEDSKVQRNDTNMFSNKCADALHAKIASWSEFASWNHLECDSPYW